MKRVIYTFGECFQYSIQEDHLKLFDGTYVDPYFMPFGCKEQRAAFVNIVHQLYNSEIHLA